jgi:hypothetical protein
MALPKDTAHTKCIIVGAIIWYADYVEQNMFFQIPKDKLCSQVGGEQQTKCAT